MCAPFGIADFYSFLIYYEQEFFTLSCDEVKDLHTHTPDKHLVNRVAGI